MSALFFPLDGNGDCALCKRRHHPGWGCPRWKKMSDKRRKSTIRKLVNQMATGGTK